MPPKRKSTQYNCDTPKKKNKLSEADDFKIKTLELKNNAILTPQIITSKTPIIEQSYQYYYIGTNKYKISINDNVVRAFLYYIQEIINNVYGMIQDKNMIIMKNLLDYKEEILLHMFCSILAHNQIIYYKSIKYIITDKNLVLGEPMYFKVDPITCTLLIYLNMTAIDAILLKTKHVPIDFSNEICQSDCQHQSAFLGSYGRRPHKLFHKGFDDLMKLFCIADHVATHYIDEYFHGKTDWINHAQFGKQLPGYKTMHIIFNVTANIQFVESASTLQSKTAGVPFDFDWLKLPDIQESLKHLTALSY